MFVYFNAVLHSYRMKLILEKKKTKCNNNNINNNNQEKLIVQDNLPEQSK